MLQTRVGIRCRVSSYPTWWVSKPYPLRLKVSPPEATVSTLEFSTQARDPYINSSFGFRHGQLCSIKFTASLRSCLAPVLFRLNVWWPSSDLTLQRLGYEEFASEQPVKTIPDAPRAIIAPIAIPRNQSCYGTSRPLLGSVTTPIKHQLTTQRRLH